MEKQDDYVKQNGDYAPNQSNPEDTDKQRKEQLSKLREEIGLKPGVKSKFGAPDMDLIKARVAARNNQMGFETIETTIGQEDDQKITSFKSPTFGKHDLGLH